MAHRKITDATGRDWDVWEVNPAAIDRRALGVSVRSDRRKENAGFAIRVSERLRRGWLAFQTHNEKRRLSPIPSGWDELPDEELLALLERAPSAGKPVRLIE